jgi:outer membrane protein assembly factor BamA
MHPVVINSVNFPGAAGGELPALQAAGKPLTGEAYLRSKMRPQEKFNFLPVYLSRGYLKAKFDDTQAKVLSDGPRTLVDVNLPVEPGIQYRLTQTNWSGNTLFPSDQLQKMLHVKSGEPANTVQLNQDLESVKKLYGTKGYLAAHVEPVPLMNDTQSTVSFDLKIVEGDLYRMGELQIDGIDPASINKITAQWQMKKGDPFDNTYTTRFFQLMYRDSSLSHGYNIVHRETIDQQEKSVSVALHFVPK